MKRMVNNSHVEGKLYQHDLTLKTTGPQSKNPGTEYITGNVEIVTDDAGINVVPVHFTYVTGRSANFKILKDIIDGVYKSVMAHGVENASMFRVDGSIGLNEFYSNRGGQEELVSTKRNEGSFIHVATILQEDEAKRNTFDCDMIINNVRHVDANEERGTAEKVIVKGVIFNFRNELMPVEFSAITTSGMDYFEGLGASNANPVFTRVRGKQISESIVRRVEEESAFGEAYVREFKSTRKDFAITWSLPEPYAWDDATTITAKELTDALANREVALVEMKRRNAEYRATQKEAVPVPSAGAFNF